MSVIGKDELAADVAARLGLSKAAAADTVTAVTASISSLLKGGDDVRLRGLGTFVVKYTKARKGRNPATGEVKDIPAGKKVAFKVASDLKGAL